MINRQQAHLVEINRLFHRLEEPKTQHSVARLHAARRHLQILVRIGNVAFSRRNPMAYHARADHVGDEFVFMPVP